MNDQDLDLILALAEGRLSSDEATAASARVAADSELAAELAEQRTALEALSASPPVAMTTEERSSLRSGLISQLNLDDPPVPIPVKRKIPWWQPALGIATAAVIVTAVIILPGNLSGDDAASEDFTAQALPQATTTAAAGGAASGADSEDDDAASTPPQTESLADARTAPVYSLDGFDGESLLEATRGQRNQAEIDDSLAKAGLTNDSSIDVARVDACLETLSADLPSGSQVPLGIEPTPDGDVVFLGVDSGEGVDSVVSIALDTCSIVDIDR
jgi:hypothetical protein